MKIMVTGANGFVGTSLVPLLAACGDEVVAGVHGDEDTGLLEVVPGTELIPLDVTDDDSVNAAVDVPFDAIVHLAAVASGAEASRAPTRAWEVNATGTARLAEAVGRRARRGVPIRFLLVSTGEVYGAQKPHRPRVETDSPRPRSPYAASKFAAEIAVLEVGQRSGLEVIVARPFAHTGPRQDLRFVIPAFARRIMEGKNTRAVAVGVGNLDPVREFLHVTDVVRAYRVLLEQGRPGEIYNVAGGRAVSMLEIFHMVAATVGYAVIPEVDSALVRPIDIPYLVGDASKLRGETNWAPAITLETTITEIVHAQAN